MPFKRQSEEEKAEKQLQKETRAEAAAKEAEAKEREKQRQAFMKSPAGQAREAYERGDNVFQYSIDVHQTKATVVSMTGAFTSSKETNDPTDVLNARRGGSWSTAPSCFSSLDRRAATSSWPRVSRLRSKELSWATTFSSAPRQTSERDAGAALRARGGGLRRGADVPAERQRRPREPRQGRERAP